MCDRQLLNKLSTNKLPRNGLIVKNKLFTFTAVLYPLVVLVVVPALFQGAKSDHHRTLFLYREEVCTVYNMSYRTIIKTIQNTVAYCIDCVR